MHHSGKILSERQKRAADLKKRTDRASGMSESEIAELRHDIKVNQKHCLNNGASTLADSDSDQINVRLR